MKKGNTSSILESLKRHFESKNSTNAFNVAAPGLAVLYKNCHLMLKDISSLKALISDNTLLDRISVIEALAKESCFELLRLIETYTCRKIYVHISVASENLLKIAQKYHCDVLELMELNTIINIYSIKEDIPILIPIKDL